MEEPTVESLRRALAIINAQPMPEEVMVYKPDEGRIYVLRNTEIVRILLQRGEDWVSA